MGRRGPRVGQGHPGRGGGRAADPRTGRLSVSHDIYVYAPGEPDLTGAEEGGIVPDPPERVDPDLLPDEVYSRTLAPEWQVLIHAPRTAGGVAIARRLARRIAEGCDGLVYDADEERVLWPRSGRRKVVRSTTPEERRVSVLSLDWCFSRRLTAADARALLAVAGRHLPEMVPTRWGVYEPLQGRGAGFDESWNGDETLFWKSRFPVYGGHVSLRRGLTRVGWHHPRLTDSLGLTLDPETTVAGSDRWRAVVEVFTVAVAEGMGAFFASAHLDADWIAVRRSLWSDHHTATHTPVARSWLGLPNFPCWLLWLGPDYRDAVSPDARRAAVTMATGTGALVRTSEDPFEARTGLETGMDPALFRRGTQLEDDLAAAVIPDAGWDDEGSSS